MTFLLGVEDQYVLGLKPMTRKNDKEENKDPSISRKRDKKAARKEASEEDKDEPEEG